MPQETRSALPTNKVQEILDTTANLELSQNGLEVIETLKTGNPGPKTIFRRVSDYCVLTPVFTPVFLQVF